MATYLRDKEDERQLINISDVYQKPKDKIASAQEVSRSGATTLPTVRKPYTLAKLQQQQQGTSKKAPPTKMIRGQSQRVPVKQIIKKSTLLKKTLPKLATPIKRQVVPSATNQASKHPPTHTAPKPSAVSEVVYLGSVDKNNVSTKQQEDNK
jgi:hypothetical protein